MSYTPAQDELINSRIFLLIKHPFWANLSLRFDFVDVTGKPPGDVMGINNEIDKVATDGRSLFYNSEYIMRASKEKNEELPYMWAHIITHLMFDQYGRRGSRDRKRYEYAMDYVTNSFLMHEGIGKVPPTALYDEKYKDMTVEQVYELLPENYELIAQKAGQELMDDHMDLQMSDQMRSDMQDAIIDACKAAGDKSPESIRRMVNSLKESVMDWRSVLRQHFGSLVKRDITWARPNRRHQGNGIFLPSMGKDTTVKAAIGIDTSGSMSEDMLTEILSEVRGIMSTFASFELHLWCYDTEVRNPQVFTPENLYDIDTYDLQGGGGTDFDVSYQYMKSINYVPEQYVNFTDGYCGSSFGDGEYCETLFIIHDDSNRGFNPPFGVVTHYYRK